MRDAKIDPAPGDLVTGTSGQKRFVIAVNKSADQPSVTFETERMGLRGKRRCGLLEWRRWCARNVNT